MRCNYWELRGLSSVRAQTEDFIGILAAVMHSRANANRTIYGARWRSFFLPGLMGEFATVGDVLTTQSE